MPDRVQRKPRKRIRREDLVEESTRLMLESNRDAMLPIPTFRLPSGFVIGDKLPLPRGKVLTDPTKQFPFRFRKNKRTDI